MVVRVFQARVQSGVHEDYERLLRETGIPLMLRQAGLIALHVGRPIPQTPNESVMISSWTDWAMLKAFTGDERQSAVVL